MSFKLNISGTAGAGKTNLLRTLGEDTFVVSRDSKRFGLPIPHMMVEKYYDMDIFLYGGEVIEDGETIKVDGVMDKLNLYADKYGGYPANIVFDTVSQLMMDIIDKASQTPDNYGSQGKEVTAEIAKFTKFLHEELELNGFNIITLNHVIDEKADGRLTGKLISFDQGKFKEKGGFFSTVNEAISIVVEDRHRVVYTNDINKLGRTTMEEVQDKYYLENTLHPSKSKKLSEGEEYFNLAEYLNKIESSQQSVEEFSL